MKKEIKETPKDTSANGKKNVRPHTAKDAGYKEEVYNHEEQKDYQKSDMAKNDKKNTAAPKD